jgi:outer membrane protein OmpA-like peptidoglycan-associated protein
MPELPSAQFPSAPTPPIADEPAGPPAPLEVERKWLESWFGGTPVRITQRARGMLEVAVPREFCFPPGGSTVKPALGAVLEKLAESVRRLPNSRLSLLAMPDDGSSNTQLTLERGSHVRRHLLGRGVLPSNLADPSATGLPEVQFRLESEAGPVGVAGQSGATLRAPPPSR